MRILLLALAMVMGATQANAQDMTEEKVKQIIREYIKENPGEIYENISAHLIEQEQAGEAAQMQNALNNRVDVNVPDYAPVRGPEDAPVQIVEFSEFQCPFCARVNPTLIELVEKYDGNVAVVFRHLPLTFHPQAMPASKAAIAAGMQGKFWEYHDVLFERQQFLGEKLYVEIAEELDLDMDKFNKDRKSKEVMARIDQDLADAKTYNAAGTPHFFINGVRFNGARPIEQFEKIINKLLEEVE